MVIFMNICSPSFIIFCRIFFFLNPKNFFPWKSLKSKKIFYFTTYFNLFFNITQIKYFYFLCYYETDISWAIIKELKLCGWPTNQHKPDIQSLPFDISLQSNTFDKINSVKQFQEEEYIFSFLFGCFWNQTHS